MKEYEKLYNEKVIISGNRVEIYKYKTYMRINKKANNKNGRKGNGGNGATDKKKKKINRKLSLNRARNNIIRLCNSNTDLETFITLTYKDNYQDLGKSKEHISYFFKKLKKDYPDLKYIYVLEFQSRGAIHYHILCNIKIDEITPGKYKSDIHKQYERNFSKKYWSNRGFVDIRNLSKEGNTNAGKYVATYLVEDLFDLDLKGNRCYGYSNNLNKPIEIKNDTKRNIEDITKEYKDYDLTFSNCYQIRFVDKTGKERSSNVNYYDFYKKEN